MPIMTSQRTKQTQSNLLKENNDSELCYESDGAIVSPTSSRAICPSRNLFSVSDRSQVGILCTPDIIGKNIDNYVIENIFGELPSDNKAKKREQDHRRKIKEKQTSDNSDVLIVDGNRQFINGKWSVVYTNATLTSYQNFPQWQSFIINLNPPKEYTTVESKSLTTCDQIVWKSNENKKILVFSFYHSKQKITIQGTDNDLRKWILQFKKEHDNPLYNQN